MQSRRKHKAQGTKWRAKVMQPCASTNRNWLATIMRQSREKWEAFRQRHTEVSALLGCGPPQNVQSGEITQASCGVVNRRARVAKVASDLPSTMMLCESAEVGMVKCVLDE